MNRSGLRAPGSSRRRAALIGLPAAITIALAGCSAGQITQTSSQRPAVGGVSYTEGDIEILNAAIEAPGATGWESGDTAGLHMTVVNSALEADEITGIEIDGVPVTLAAPTDGAASSDSPAAEESSGAEAAAETTAAESTASDTAAPEAAESAPLEVPAQGVATIGEDEDAQATFEVSEGPLYTSASVPITVTFANAGELSFDITVGSPQEEQDRDPDEVTDLHEHGGGEGEEEGGH